MKHTPLLLILLMLAACAAELPQPRQEPVIPKIEIITAPEMPEKPKYEPPPSTPANATEITMEAKMFQFLPNEIKVNKGEYVRLIITSQDIEHKFLIPAYDINKELKPAEDTIVEFKADKEGMFTFYCDIPGHEEMKGKLIVT